MAWRTTTTVLYEKNSDNIIGKRASTDGAGRKGETRPSAPIYAILAKLKQERKENVSHINNRS
jgi:hypothetical protein